jgi:hypothetical protein
MKICILEKQIKDSHMPVENIGGVWPPFTRAPVVAPPLLFTLNDGYFN